MKTSLIYCLLIAGTMLVSCKPSSEQSEKVEKKAIGVQLYSVRDAISADFATTIKAVGEAGYYDVEAANYNDGKFYGLDPEAFKKAVEEAGMKVLSSHTGQLLPPAGTTPDWDALWAWWDQCIDAHLAAGMQYIVVPYMPIPATLAELQATCDYFNQIGEKCKAKGLKFGYHNHAHEFQKVEEQTIYDYMLEHTDPGLVFFQMDVYWTVMGRQSPVDYFNKYPGRFELLHIKDNKELGQSGMVGFDAIFKNTDQAGVKHLIVEVEKYNYAPIESIKLSLDYLLKCPLVKKSYEDL
ncbi:MAG: sugar phosphate isomerase/epimerase [Dysgonamonadaceae bacterium]|jgi:sugar phosphate isomerase/epimerase|nr:sugar phosphate isomerase/epimerase [Dysgonamonadaceae bacterium]